MNILMIRSDLKRAGPGVSIHRLSSQLRQRGEHVVVVSSGGALSKQMSEEGFRVYELDGLGIGRRAPLNILRGLRGIRRVLAEEKIEVVHGHNMISTMLAWVAGLGLGNRRRRFFTSIHGKGQEWLLQFVPGTLIGVSQHQLDYVRRYAPRKPTYCLYSTNPWIADASRFLDPGRPLRLASIAHFTGLKGHDRLVEVAVLLRDRGVDFTLSMVGAGPVLPGIREKIDAAGVQDQIVLLGEQCSVRDILEQHDLFVHLPDYETFGIVCQEALCSGLPVVAAKVGGIPEIVADSAFGALVDLSWEDALSRAADAIVSFSDPARYAEASARALDHVQAFAPDHILTRLIWAYGATEPRRHRASWRDILNYCREEPRC